MPHGSRRGSNIPIKPPNSSPIFGSTSRRKNSPASPRSFLKRILPSVLAATRDQLATTLSPNEIAQLSYDPFGLTRLPDNVAGPRSGFGQGQELFASADGTFRIIFVKARGDLNGYRECTDWFNAVKQNVIAAVPARMK